jgi:hypothetical protein
MYDINSLKKNVHIIVNNKINQNYPGIYQNNSVQLRDEKKNTQVAFKLKDFD